MNYISKASEDEINDRIWSKYFALEPGMKKDFTNDFTALEPLIAKHEFWCFKRNGFQNWEIRYDLSGKSIIHERLTMAICLALLEEDRK